MIGGTFAGAISGWILLSTVAAVVGIGLIVGEAVMGTIVALYLVLPLVMGG